MRHKAWMTDDRDDRNERDVRDERMRDELY
jgi:hypothetical protein